MLILIILFFISCSSILSISQVNVSLSFVLFRNTKGPLSLEGIELYTDEHRTRAKISNCVTAHLIKEGGVSMPLGTDGKFETSGLNATVAFEFLSDCPAIKYFAFKCSDDAKARPSFYSYYATAKNLITDAKATLKAGFSKKFDFLNYSDSLIFNGRKPGISQLAFRLDAAGSRLRRFLLKGMYINHIRFYDSEDTDITNFMFVDVQDECEGRNVFDKDDGISYPWCPYGFRFHIQRNSKTSYIKGFEIVTKRFPHIWQRVDRKVMVTMFAAANLVTVKSEFPNVDANFLTEAIEITSDD